VTPIIRVEQLEKSFGGFRAVYDISLDILPGQITGVIGANGAGKTTFVNMITGHLKPTRGTISFEGRDITGLPSRRVARLGISRSFQMPQTFPSLSVEDNIAVATAIASTPPSILAQMLTPIVSAETAEPVDRIVDQFQLGAYRDKPAQQLPQGVRKILDIAMAVVSRPRVIMLDEPTSGISVEEKYVLMEIVIKALKANDMTILFVEHDMEIIGRFADRVLAFYEGTVIADGPPSTVLSDPRVQQFVTGTPHVPAEQVEAGHA
jgi:branched-chain amino acid transport system ATP-binding protein